MKTKNISYLLLASLFTISGCGSQSSSSDPSSVESLQEAIYLIPKENISNNSYKTQPITSGSRNSYKVTNTNTLEDAEDGTTNGWRSYDRSPKSVVISNLYDNSKKSKVIDLKGVGTKNGAYFSLQSNSTANTIKWNMNFNEDYTIYVRLNTTNGSRYIYYTPADYNYGKAPAPYSYYLHHGLGSTSNNGTWQTFSRDLVQDLKEFEPNNTINSIEGLYIRGSGRIDDISLLKTQIDSECIGYHNLRNKINNNEDVRNADISCITDMSGIFTNNKTFNQDISSWDTSNVTNMAWMFNGASAFNQDISYWDTSKVTSTQGMFNHAYAFNQNINAWNVSNVTNMDYMFTHAEAFEQDLSLWQVNSVQSHKSFSYATASGTIEPNWNAGNLIFKLQEALASQINYTKSIKEEEIIDLPNERKLIKIKTGYAHVNVSNPDSFKVTRFDSTYGDIYGALFTSVLSKAKDKLFILSADEGTYVRVQVIDLVALKEIQYIKVKNIPAISIPFNGPPIYLSDDEQKLIIPKEYGIWETRTDILVDLYPYIRAIDRGFEIYDTSSPSNPILVTTYHLFAPQSSLVDNITLLEDKQNILIGVKSYLYYIVNISDIHNPVTKGSLRIGRSNIQAGLPAKIKHLTDNKYLLYNNSEAYIYNFDTYKIEQTLSFTQFGVTFLSKDEKLLLDYTIGKGTPALPGLTIYDISNLDNITSKKYPLDKIEQDREKIKITEDDGTQIIIELM